MTTKSLDEKFSSTQINIPFSTSRKIIKWGKDNISDENLYIDENKGRETKPHVTILYGLHINDPKEMKEFINEKPFSIKLGNISKFECLHYDVIKIDVTSQELMKLNKKIASNFDVTSKHEYSPHLTIAYIKKGTCNELVGDNTFKNIIIKVNDIYFCDKDRNHTKIKL